MNSLLSAFVFAVAIVKPFHCLDDVNIAETVSRNLEQRLHTLVNSTLDISALENIYETKTRFITEQYNPREVLGSLVGNISERLDGAVNILKRNRDYVETNYSNHSLSTTLLGQSTTLCCNDQQVYFNARFGLIHDFKACFSKLNNGIRDFPADIDDFYQENLDDSLIILWQYFGDIYGHYHQYPWKPRFCSKNKDTDHRFLDWYVYTASPQKKNVVIVVDESGSMGSAPIIGMMGQNTTQRVDIAKAAARTVLDTLSPTDHVGIVAFSNEPRSPSGCLGNKVTRATAENKNIIHQFLDTVTPKIDTYYGKAFKAAFKLLHGAKQQTPGQFEDSLDMILFLTDGTPSESNINTILEEIVTGQNNMNHTVQIFVYGLGKNILNTKNKTSTDLLLKIADQNNQKMPSMFGIPGGSSLAWQNVPNLADNSKPLGPVGNLTILSDIDSEQLNNVMGSYYTKFPMSQQTEYRVGHPHVEERQGLVITLGIPTLDSSGDFYGVAAVDIAVELMFYEVIHFRRGQHSYGFIVRSDGKVIVHPYMIEPRHQFSQPKMYNIHQIEPVLTSEAVYNITHGIEGQYSSKLATRNFWRKSDSSSLVAKAATYYYQPVHNFHENYTVVMVIFDEDIEELKADEDVENGEFPSFIYHRMDFYDNDTLLTSELCSRDDGFVLQNNATVKFAPSVYENPVKSVEYEQNINKSYPIYQHFRNAKLFSQGADIHQSASNDIVLTNITDQLWKMDDIIWRYLGTGNGFFKIFPGTMLTDIHYDPRNDLWYKKASNHPDSYVFMPMDTDQNSSYVTMAKVFHQTSNGTVSGVAAADISRHQFTTILHNILSGCQHCYVLDDSGFVLAQSIFLHVVERKHITEIAGHVSFVLKQKGFLKSETCMNSTSSEKKLIYNLNLGDLGSDVRQIGCHDYVLTSINRTNLFLLMYKPDNCKSMIGSCICQENCLFCDNQMDTVCQCPCRCLNRTIDDCSSNFTMSQGYKPCQDDERHWSSVKTLNLQLSNISQCQPQCPSLQNKTSCLSLPGCSWCTHGLYKHVPLCTGNCPMDSFEISLRAPCNNLSKVSEQSLFSSIKTAVSDLIQDPNLNIGTPILMAEDETHFNMSTMDGTSVPDRWIDILTKPLHINIADIVLVSTGQDDNVTMSRVILKFSNINFTNELESELTLRDYIETQIQHIVSQLLSGIEVVVLDVWFEQNEISCIISPKDTNMWKTVLDYVMSWTISSFSTIDVFGKQLSLVNIYVRNVTSPGCKQHCEKLTDHDDCNNYQGCHWDVYNGGICTNDSALPEKIEATIYLPCLSLYTNITQPENEVVRLFRGTLQQYVPELLRTLHSVSLKKDISHIGTSIEFVLQGRVTSPPVAELWFDLQQIFNQNQNTSLKVDEVHYSMNLQPITYQQFTNMHIMLIVERLDLENLVEQHPLDGRDEIKSSVTDTVMLYLRPQVVRSLGSFKLNKNEIAFSVDNSFDKGVDLRSEYDILQTAVTNNMVNITIYRQIYKVNNVFFVGSFDQLCPRNCSQGNQITCDSIPGCDWSHYDQCVSEVIYPERKNVSVVFPCIDFSFYSNSEILYIQSVTEDMISSYWKNKSQSDVVDSSYVHVGTFNSITISLQATSKSPSLAVLYRETQQWITIHKIRIHVNGSTITGTSGQDYTSVSVALEYSNINFTLEPMERRKLFLGEIISRTKLVLSEGISITKEWLTMNYLLFDFVKNEQYPGIDLNNEVEKVEKFIDLGGLRLKLENITIEPLKIHTNGSVGCYQSDCFTEKKCFWDGQWSSNYCLTKRYPDRYMYEAYLPCNQTQLLTPDEVNETAIVLLNRTLQILNISDPSVVLSVDITPTGAVIEVQSTPLHPYIEQYSELLWQEINYRGGFSFSPSSRSVQFIPRHRRDFTNVDINLLFRSIDFDAIVNSGLANKQNIASLLLAQINLFMLGELVQSFQLHAIEKDYIKFSMKKSIESLLDMSIEIGKLWDRVNNGLLKLDINYVRPVMATFISLHGSFQEICNSLTGHSTGSNLVPTFSTNITSPKVPVAMIPVPTILVVYNKSTTSPHHLLPVIDTLYVDVCFIQSQQCPSCVNDYSWETCSMKPKVIRDGGPNKPFDDIGPVQWTIIGVAAVFILALAIMAAQGLYEATKKKDPKGPDSYEDNE